MPVSEVKQDDTWYCAGLRGSGSITAVLDDVFVPEHRSVSFADLARRLFAGHKVNTNPIYRTPFIAVHTYALLAPALGLARGGYADFTEWTRKRYLTYTQLAIAQHVPVQIKLAEIAAQIDAAELLARRCFATARADYAGMSMETRTLAPPRLDLRHEGAARRDGCAGQDQRLQRPDGGQPGAALLARRARHLVACGDELGRAGGEFRPDGVWAPLNPAYPMF